MTNRRRQQTPGVVEVFERLLRRHRSEIYRTILRQSRNREDAEDLTQITFLNAYAALRRGAEPEAPRAWLHAIARNAASRRFRQSRVDVELDTEVALPVDENVPTAQELRTALARLTFNQRASLLMREVGGLSAAEIGARLGLSPGAVATLLFRARRALRSELETAGFHTRGERSWLGGLSVLCGSVGRWTWVRLFEPAFGGAETLSRLAVCAASVAAGAVVLTSAQPVLTSAHPASAAVPRVHDIPRWTASRSAERLVESLVPAVRTATPAAHNQARAPSTRVTRVESAGTAAAPPVRPRDGEVSAPAPADVREQPAEHSDDLVHRLVDAAPLPPPAAVAQPLDPVDVHLPVTIPDPSQLTPAVSADLPAVTTLPDAIPPDPRSLLQPP